MRGWLLLVACGCFAQGLQTADERIKVTGPANPFSAELVEVYERSAAVGGGFGLRGSIRNEAKTMFFDLNIIARVKRASGPPIEIMLTIDRIEDGGSSLFVETLKGLTSSSDPQSISFEVVGFLTAIQLEQKERRAEAARQAALAAAASKEEAERKKLLKQLAELDAEEQVLLQELRRRCQALRSQIKTKTINSLTVDEVDRMEACKQRGLW